MLCTCIQRRLYNEKMQCLIRRTKPNHPRSKRNQLSYPSTTMSHQIVYAPILSLLPLIQPRPRIMRPARLALALLSLRISPRVLIILARWRSRRRRRRDVSLRQLLPIRLRGPSAVAVLLVLMLMLLAFVLIRRSPGLLLLLVWWRIKVLLVSWRADGTVICRVIACLRMGVGVGVGRVLWLVAIGVRRVGCLLRVLLTGLGSYRIARCNGG